MTAIELGHLMDDDPPPRPPIRAASQPQDDKDRTRMTCRNEAALRTASS